MCGAYPSLMKNQACARRFKPVCRNGWAQENQDTPVLQVCQCQNGEFALSASAKSFPGAWMAGNIGPKYVGYDFRKGLGQVNHSTAIKFRTIRNEDRSIFARG